MGWLADLAGDDLASMVVHAQHALTAQVATSGNDWSALSDRERAALVAAGKLRDHAQAVLLATAMGSERGLAAVAAPVDGGATLDAVDQAETDAIRREFAESLKTNTTGLPDFFAEALPRG